MKDRPLFIRADWDEEARVWVATSDDVPGLATEEVSIERLIAKLKIMIPELLEANSVDTPAPYRAFEVLSRRFETLEYVSG